jgi:Tfp pilus assembly protein PilN
MDKVNFITSLPASLQKELRRWYAGTLMSVGGLVSLLTGYSMYQAFQWYFLHNTVQQYQANAAAHEKQRAAYQALEHKEHTLMAQMNHIKQYGQTATKKSVMHALMALLKQTPDMSVESVTVQKQHIEVRVGAPAYGMLKDFMHSMSTISAIDTLALTALHTTHQGHYYATLSASLGKRRTGTQI